VRTSDFSRYACRIAAVAILTACSVQSQPQLEPVGATPKSVARAAKSAAQFAYVTNSVSNDVSAYSIDASDGALTLVGTYDTESGPFGLTIDPAGRFAYVANLYSANVSAYTIDTKSGRLTPVTGSPFEAGSGPYYVALDPTGAFAYVTNSSSDTISAYSINGKNGALTAVKGSPFATGTDPIAVAVDPTGKFLYVGDESTDEVSAYTISRKSGALRPVNGSPFATGGYNPISLAVDPAGKFAFVANLNSSDVSVYTIDRKSGALTPVAGSPFAANGDPIAVAIDPTGKFAYVTNNIIGNSSYVSAFSIKRETGALTQVAGSPFKAGSRPFGIALDYNVTHSKTANFAYVANYGSNNVSAYTIDVKSGVLRSVKGSPFTAGSNPAGIATCRVEAGKCVPPQL
jgi:6-phosphogluconolactonase